MKKLATILFLLLTVSCIPSNSSNSPGSNTLSGGKGSSTKAVEVGWESGDVLQDIFYPYSLCNKPYDAQISTDFARSGIHSVRFELRSSDATCGNSKRAELYIPQSNTLTSTLKWYAWSEYLPNDFVTDSNAESHFQLHHSGNGSPPIGLWVQSGRWYLVQSYDQNEDGTITTAKHDLGVISKNAWTDWVLYFDSEIDSSGKIMLWKNGVKVLDLNGPNFNMVGGVKDINPNPKFGIYKWPWATAGSYSPNTRIIYIDDVSMGDATNTIDDFLTK